MQRISIALGLNITHSHLSCRQSQHCSFAIYQRVPYNTHVCTMHTCTSKKIKNVVRESLLPMQDEPSARHIHIQRHKNMHAVHQN